MAHCAGLILLRLVMECGYGRSAHVHGECVAFKAEQVHVCAPEQSWVRRPVRLMTIGARDKTLIHFVMKRLGKIRLGFQMAAVTKGWLRCAQQLALNLR